MPSPNDNIKLKNALAENFEMRSKDVSLAQDGSLQTVRHLAVPHPVDYGTGGCFQLCSKSGTMIAAIAANSPIYSFRWTSTTHLALLRRVRLQAWGLGTAFTAGIASFDMFVCRGWTVADTDGATETLTTDNGNLRTSMPATLLSEIRRSATDKLTAGTRTKDTQPVASVSYEIGTVANKLFNPNGVTNLFEKLGAEHPLVMAQNEGFVIQATVPATGTWSWTITPEWDEVLLQNY